MSGEIAHVPKMEFPVLSTLRRLAVAVALISALVATPAQAADLGGSIAASIDGGNVLRAEVLWYEAGTCTVGAVKGGKLLWMKREGGASPINTAVGLVAEECTASTSVYRGVLSLDLTPLFGTGAGPYLLWMDGTREAGTENQGHSLVLLESRVTYAPGTVRSTPTLAEPTPFGFSLSQSYDADFAPSDPEGGAVTQTLLQGASSGAAAYNEWAPLVQRAALDGDGHVVIADTSPFSAGQFVTFKLQATDTDGDWVARDVMLRASSNVPPVFGAGTTALAVTAGQRRTLALEATDSIGSVVTLDADGLPAWASLTSTAGNPAGGELVLEPPAGVTGAFSFSVRATDDHAELTLGAQRAYTVTVAAPSAPPPGDQTTGPEADESHVPPGPQGPTAFRVLTLKRGDARAGGTFLLEVPRGGTIVTEAVGFDARSGRSLKVFARTTLAERAGRLRVDARLSRASLRGLARRGLTRVRISVTFVPADGAPVTVEHLLKLKRFSMLCLCREALSADRRAMRVVTRVPYAARLQAYAKAKVGSREVLLGRSRVRKVTRGEREITLRLDAEAIRRAIAAGATEVRVVSVLHRPGQSLRTRTRTFSVAELS
jgi:hypothetical protein